MRGRALDAEHPGPGRSVIGLAVLPGSGEELDDQLAWIEPAETAQVVAEPGDAVLGKLLVAGAVDQRGDQHEVLVELHVDRLRIGFDGNHVDSQSVNHPYAELGIAVDDGAVVERRARRGLEDHIDVVIRRILLLIEDIDVDEAELVQPGGNTNKINIGGAGRLGTHRRGHVHCRRDNAEAVAGNA